MCKGLLPWAEGYCRGPKVIIVGKELLPWAKGYQYSTSIAVGQGYCRGPSAIAVGKRLLPWAKGYCREQRAIAVGHFAYSNSPWPTAIALAPHQYMYRSRSR